MNSSLWGTRICNSVVTNAPLWLGMGTVHVRTLQGCMNISKSSKSPFLISIYCALEAKEIASVVSSDLWRGRMSHSVPKEERNRARVRVWWESIARGRWEHATAKAVRDTEQSIEGPQKPASWISHLIVPSFRQGSRIEIEFHFRLVLEHPIITLRVAESKLTFSHMVLYPGQ